MEIFFAIKGIEFAVVNGGSITWPGKVVDHDVDHQILRIEN